MDMQMIIIISAVVATFMGFYKNKDDEVADFKKIKSVPGIATASAGLVVIIVASASLAIFNAFILAEIITKIW